MKRLVFLTSLVAILEVATNASERRDADMLAAACRQLTGATVNGSRSLQPQEVKLLMKDRGLSVYGSDAGGFVVVSRDDRFPAVIGYSDTKFNTSDMPEGFKWWIEEVSQSMQQLAVTGGWYTALEATQVVEPMLTTQWSQSEPYNLLCPKVATSRCPAGCVATAAAQIMKFFNYPAQGRGEATYTKNGIKKTASIESVYDWSNMKDYYASTQKSLTDANRAVAQLISDVGMASGMSYTVSYGGTNLQACAKGLGENFQYDSLALRLCYRDFFTEEEWNELLVNELVNEHRPILYAGSPKDGSAGHAFVFDGIDADGRVHVNWGWAGKCDGYFNITFLNPGSAAEQKGDYSYSNNMLIGFTPHDTPAEGAKEKTMWAAGAPCELSIDETDSLVLTTNMLFNIGHRDFYGQVFLAMDNINGFNDDSHKILIYDSEHETEDGEKEGPIPFAYGFSFSEDQESTGSEGLVWLKDEIIKPGTYALTLVSQGLLEDEPTLVHAIHGTVCKYTLIKGEDGSLNLTEGLPTAINNVKANSQRLTDGLYTLSGQKMTREWKGIYIKNGKKFVR